ncbi:MAG: cell division protein FtsQ/DivIB, partial [Deltaproteobacteria bacterium]|nr:cell division protein FtsQ/DivIB [Deltaproteobacteria bacterium]
WIRRATVDKRMPATVVVRIVERLPVALLAGDGTLQLMAEDGSVMGPTTSGGAPDLPVLTGFDLDRRRTDPVGLRQELTAAVELLRLLEEVGLPGSRSPAELHLSVRGGFDLLTGDALVVHLGPGPYRPKLKRLAEAIAALDAHALHAAEIFLPGTRHPDRVSVRLGP